MEEGAGAYECRFLILRTGYQKRIMKGGTNRVKIKRYKFRTAQRINRKYKDRLFRFVFQNKKDLLELYNAINGTDYQDEEELEINTLENVLYLSMKNDLSFLLCDTMNLYEHQSTWNENMPLRGLLYFAELYQRYLECRAVVLNINYGHNQAIMERCRRLKDYSEFIEEIRRNLRAGMVLEDAVEQGIEACIRRGILEDILRKSKMEVRKMLLTEYDEKAEREYLRKEAVEMGLEEGREQGLQEGICAFILDNLEENVPKERILSKLERRFSLTPEQAEEYFEKYGREEQQAR